MKAIFQLLFVVFIVFTGVSAKADYTQHWWNPAQNGMAVPMHQQGNTIVATWFMYEASGQPSFLAFSGTLAKDAQNRDVLTSNLYRVTSSAPVNYDPSRFNATSVGRVTVTFNSATSATMHYSFSGQQGTLDLLPYVFGDAVAATSGFVQHWWNPAQNGMGVPMHRQGSTIVATWFMYEPSGQPSFLAFSGTLAKDAQNRDVLSSNLYRVTSSAPVNYDPSRFNASSVGTVAVTFNSTTSATMQFSFSGQQGTLNLVPYVFGDTVTAAPVTINFIHFSDLHAHLTPHIDKVVVNGQPQVQTRGGLARVSQAIKTMRVQYPNTIAMNIGDAYHGGVEALYTNGNAIIDPVNAVGFDVGVPGNWDFAFGGDVTRLRYAALTTLQARALELRVGSIKRPSFPQLAANVAYASGCPQSGQLLPATLTKTVGGVKVGFIGLSSDIVPMMGANLANCLVFTQGETDYKNLIELHATALRSQGAQIVVVMSELGIHKNSRLAQVIRKGSVDVIFSAHTHEATAAPLQSDSGALVVESGNDGNIGRMAITLDGGVVVAREWQLTPVTAAQTEDPIVASLVASARAPFLAVAPSMSWSAPLGVTQRLTKPINTVVGYVSSPLDRRGALTSSFNNAFGDWLRAKTATDIALTPGFRFDAVVPAAGTLFEANAVANGAVTLEDVYRFFPLAYGISTGRLSGQRLNEILKQNLDAVFARDEFSQQGGWVDAYSGLRAVIDLSGQAAQVVSFGDARGFAINPATIYTATGCERPFDAADVMCGYSGFSNVAPLINSATSAQWTVVDIAEDMFKANAVRSPNAPTLTLQNAPPLWPESPYVQPLSANVSAQVTVTRSPPEYDSTTQTYRVSLQVKNDLATKLLHPIHLEVSGLVQGATLVNALGTRNGTPYLRIDTDLAAGQSASVTAVFANPGNQTLNYTVKTYAGGV